MKRCGCPCDKSSRAQQEIWQYNVYAVRLRFKAAESVISVLLIQWSYGLVGEAQAILC